MCASEEESKEHEKVCLAASIEIPSSPARPTTAPRQLSDWQKQGSGEGEAEKKPAADNVMFGLPDGSFVMISETSESDVDRSESVTVSIFRCKFELILHFWLRT